MIPDYTARYIALKALKPEAHRKAILYAEGLTLLHMLDPKVAVDIEAACILLACELLEVEP